MQTQHQQKGAALLATLLVIMTIALGYLTHAISSLNQSLERQALSSERLAVAKDALLGYMLVSEDDGRLPLPDMGLKTPPHTEGVAANNFTGNNADAVLIGRLPWKSIGSGPIFDESNECLWYAVAGAWKKSNITIPTFNWDTLGDFELFVPDGQGNTTPQSDNPHQNRPVALIFAPGPPLAGQDRTPSTQTGEIISKCGGNYRTINYLDPSSALVAFDGRATPLLTGTPPEGRESDYSNDSNNALGSITPDKPKSILNAPSFTQNNIASITNDKFSTITADDIFHGIKTKETFHGTLNGLLSKVATCLESQNLPSTGLNPLGVKNTGRLLDAMNAGLNCSNISGNDLSELIRWRDNIWLLQCPVAPCLNIINPHSSPPSNKNCAGAVVFSGSRNSAQRRASNAQKLDPAQYFENSVLNTFLTANATELTAGALFPSNKNFNDDTVLCLNRPIVLSDKPDVSTFTPSRPFANTPLTTVDTTTQSVILGNLIAPLETNISGQAVGCTWLPPAEFASGLRIYFRFVIQTRGDGFFAALIDAERNLGDNRCGGADDTGQFLGYAGINTDAFNNQITEPLEFPKIGLEFDTEKNATNRRDTTDHDIALMYWGYSEGTPRVGYANLYEDDNVHGFPTALQTGYLDPPSTEKTGTFINLRKTPGTQFFVRWDLTRSSDSLPGRHHYQSRVWIAENNALPGMGNVNTDFFTINTNPTLSQTVSINDKISGNELFKYYRFGFTNAQTNSRKAGSKQSISINDLTIKARP